MGVILVTLSSPRMSVGRLRDPVHVRCALCVRRKGVPADVLHGESSTDQASPRTPTQRTCQPQEAVQP